MARWLNRGKSFPTAGWKIKISLIFQENSVPDDGDLAHTLGVVDHMLEEKLRDRGGEKALFHGDADLARLLDVERQRGDAVASGLDEQAVHDADAKSRLDHGQEREVVS